VFCLSQHYQIAHTKDIRNKYIPGVTFGESLLPAVRRSGFKEFDSLQ
jgi:hypothetical protein